MTTDQQCNHSPKINAVFIIDAKDIVYKNGEMKIKRKYGKFKREIKHYIVPQNKN